MTAGGRERQAPDEGSASELLDAVVHGDRRALARAITLVESSLPAHRERALELLEAAGDAAPTRPAIRAGITGVPGVGKSTFIEALGSRLVDAGRRVAVLAVDPTSVVSGGSILGDKTRMERLARSDAAFVRPSPGGSAFGGVARRSREVITLCEAAGYDVVLVETIGVGQSETAVADLVDVFVLLTLAGAGDELQGIKRGILEVADVVAVTKADGDNLDPAERAARELRGALAILHGGNHDDVPNVLLTSARSGDGIDSLWQDVEERFGARRETGTLEANRFEQDARCFERAVRDLLAERFFADSEAVGRFTARRDEVRAGRAHPTVAAHRLLEAPDGDASGHG